jgi:serine/threonine protein kinase
MRFGRYETVRQLASGGMSEVYLARPVDGTRSDEPVVVKRMLPSLATDPHFVELFERELRTARLMDHPNIVRLLDTGHEAGEPFIVMEYIEGVDCWKLSQRCGSAGQSISPDVAIFIVCQVLRALSHVHLAKDEAGSSLKLVHGDVSPSNIYLSRDGDVKLGDFGIAWTSHQGHASERGPTQGKLDYLAPEQVTAGSVDYRADLFSAAVVLCELLCRERLFHRDTELTTLIAIRDVRLDVLEAHAGHIPGDAEPILRKALSRTPGDRFPTAGSMRRSLERAVATPSDELRRELSRLVQVALEQKSPSGPKVLPVVALPPPPPSDVETEFVIIDEPPQDTLLPMTPVQSASTYTFRDPDGATFGPMGYAAAVEGVVSGRFRSGHDVSIGAGPYVSLSLVRELSRHAPSLTPPTKEVASVGPPDRRGLLDDEPIWRVLFELAVSEETGLAIFQQGDLRKEVFFVNGDPHHVSSNAPSELLGTYLVEQGVITTEQLDEALDALPAYQGHLGETLASLGHIRPLTLFRAISDHIRERVLDLFGWKHGEYSLYRDMEPRDATFPLDLRTLHLLWPGIKRTTPIGVSLAWLEAHESWTIRAVPEPRATLSELGLPDDVVIALSLDSKPVPVQQVVQAMAWGVSEADAALAIFLVHHLGLLELLPP